MRVVALACIIGAMLVSPALADPHPRGFTDHPFNGPRDAVTENGVTTFTIVDEGCGDVDYGDGRGESDCGNGNIRSMLSYEPNAKLGQTLDYRFDFLIDPTFDYEGYLSSEAAGFEPGAWDSMFRIATWEGPFLHNFLYILKVSKKAGVTFAGQQCQAPEDFGKWVSFSLKIKWTADDRGWIAVSCNQRYVYVDEGVATNVAPHCYTQNQCVPGEARSPRSVNYIIGAQMAGWGHAYADIGKDTPFVPIREGGISISMRNIAVAPDPVLYAPDQKALVTRLQQALNALGCAVGKADGVSGAQTRLAALTCRKFADGAMPRQLNVATLETFVALYTAEGVADLPPGELPAAPVVVHLEQSGSENDSREGQIVTAFHGAYVGPHGREDLDFLLIGEFNYALGYFTWLNLLLGDDIGSGSGAETCDDVRVEDWGAGGIHAVLDFDIRGKSVLVAKSADCLIPKLPEGTAHEAEFLLTNFGAVARSLVADGTLSSITNAGVRTFMQSLAEDEIRLGMR